MFAWWDSLDAVTNVTWWLKWVGAGLTVFGALCVIATLATSKRGETLKERQEASKQEEVEIRERALRTRLEAAEERQRDRHLTASQAARLVEVLRGYSGGTVLMKWSSADREPFVYADELARAFQSAGWTVGEGGGFIENPIPVGLIVRGNLPSPLATALLEAFHAADIPVTQLPKPNWPEGKFELMVGLKPSIP